MPSTIGELAGGTGVAVGANYLRVLQSPGAALAGVANGAPLLTFSTPNLRMFKVVITAENVTVSPEASNSSWSQVVRALQVTSELFAVFAPTSDGTDSTFCFMAPDFNTNAGAPTTASDPLSAPTFSVLEAAIVAAVGGTATVTYATIAGTTIS